jgi:hypothetical protein
MEKETKELLFNDHQNRNMHPRMIKLKESLDFKTDFLHYLMELQAVKAYPPHMEACKSVIQDVVILPTASESAIDIQEQEQVPTATSESDGDQEQEQEFGHGTIYQGLVLNWTHWPVLLANHLTRLFSCYVTV